MIRITDSVAVLKQAPVTLTAMLSGLPDIWLHATEGEGKWSAYDVVGHLVHGERTDWIARARQILERRTDPFASFDRTAMFRESAGRPIADLLDEFSRLRASNLEILTGFELSAEDLDLPGVHPLLGAVTLGQLIATWVVHDLDHIAQIARTMAKVYTDDVGPWRDYLSILEDRR